ncbi:MAG TPA: hypothetical protein VFC39_02395 [Acidobacteriaceae bacterium]|nr:hypothetical protein [Acidobacteriaceae bacterium]
MRKVAAIVFSGFVVVLTGCTAGTAPGNISTVTPGVATVKNGVIHGGQNPVTGATVQLWQVGTTGYGVGAAALGSSTTSLADGSFSITGDYSCTNAANGNSTLVYITATGGDAGGGTNHQLSMMTALGTCGSLTSSTFITVNEVTTVASVYALAQFMSPAGAIGAYGYSNTGLLNAFATVNNLVNTGTGVANSVTPAGNGVVPSAEIDTLANIIASCVNSASIVVTVTPPVSTPSANCSALFTAATPTGSGSAGSTAPTTTLAAALNIALYPWYNAGATSTLFPLSPPTPPFGPALTVAPNDWTMALSFNGGGISVRSVAMDGSGSVWTANYAAGADGLGSVSKLGTLGNPLTGSPFTGNVVGPYAVAIDTNGDAWVVNHDANQLIGFSSTGNTLGQFQYPETNNPSALAIDGRNNIWITNSGSNTVSETNLVNLGSAVPLSGGGLNSPSAVAIDAGFNGWITDRLAGAVSKFDQHDTAISGTGGYTGSGLNLPIGIAMDSAGDAWVVNAGASTLSEFNSSGVPVGSGFTIGGTGVASAVAVDGSGRVYALKRTPLLALFNSAGTEITGTGGFVGGNMSGPDAMAIDASGNVWVGNQAPVTVNGAMQTVTEFVGLATPSITPLSMAVQTGQVGQEPGTPIPVAFEPSYLPPYGVGVAYSVQLHATGGNTGGYSWTLASGSLPTGLSLGPSGVISGTSNVNAQSSFTVTVCDAGNAANCATSGTLTITGSNSLPVGGGEGMLSGSYVVRFGGFNNVNGNFGVVNGFDEVMQLNFNGTGAIGTGEYDYNNPSTHNITPISITGTYTLGTDQRGLMALKLGATQISYAIAVGTLNGGVAQELRMVEFDDTHSSGAAFTGTGTGIGKKQTSATISFNQNFVFGIQGETPCSTPAPGCAQSLTPFGPISAAGYFTGDASGHITAGGEDAAAYQIGYSGITLNGSYTPPDAFGRGTITLTPAGTVYPAPPSGFVYYVVSPTEMFMMSSDVHSTSTMLMGDVLAQTTAFTTSSTLAGNYVLYQSQAKDNSGGTMYPNVSAGLVAQLAFSGSQFNAVADQNNPNNGTPLKLGMMVPGVAYTIDANGRMPVPDIMGVFYLAGASGGFGTELPAAGDGSAGLFRLEQQTGSGYSCTTNVNAAGTYFLGDIQSPIRKAVSTGNLVQAGDGTGMLTIDNSDPSGILTQGGTDTITCGADANGIATATTGRVSYVNGSGGNSIGYAISPTKTVIMSANPGETTVSVVIVQQ